MFLMTRRILSLLIFSGWLAGGHLLRAETTNGALVRAVVLENNVAYLLVGDVKKNLPDEIQSAENTLAASNKIAGTVLDLRFAGGNDLDSAKAIENLFAAKKLPLAILVNGETRGAAIELAKDLRAAKDGLIFGETAKDLQPDISVSVKAGDEKKYLENPYAVLPSSETNTVADTNDFGAFIDHTSEADLVREKIKDGDEDENSAPPRPTAPPKPYIHDPVLARAVDLIKDLAFMRHQPQL